MHSLKLIIILGFLWISNLFCSEYQNIDEFAKNRNSRFENSKELAVSLNDSGFNETEKLRALYTWIANNIEYDVNSFESGLRPWPLPNITLKKGKAVCYGYAILFDSVCHYFNIPSFVVLGYTKYGFNPRSSDHAWNVVKINNEWKFIDVTWGSGKVEKIEKQGIFNKILKRPRIKSTLVFVKKMNNKYFLISADSLLKTHLPSDPMWQLRNYPVSLDEFLSGNQTDSLYFNYSDTLKNFLQLKEAEQKIASASRANRFNQLNYYDMAFAYITEGINQYKNAESIVPESTDYLKKVLMNASDHLSKGYYNLEKGKQVDDSIYRNKVSEIKGDYKKTLKNLKNYKRDFDKTNTKNTRYADKIKGESKKINQLKNQYYEKGTGFVLDEKIYLVERPEELPVYKDSLIFMKNKKLVDSLFVTCTEKRDTIAILMNSDLKLYYDSILIYRKQIPTVLEEIFARVNVINKIYADNMVNTFEIADNVFNDLYNYYNKFVLYHSRLEDISKNIIKTKHKEIRDLYKSFESDAKKLKSNLITIKKYSLISQGEEDKYEEINELVNNSYQQYIIRLTENQNLLQLEKEEIKTERKILKQDIRALDRTNDLVSAYYEDNINKMKTRYNNEREVIKQLSKTVVSAGNVCLKALGE